MEKNLIQKLVLQGMKNIVSKIQMLCLVKPVMSLEIKEKLRKMIQE